MLPFEKNTPYLGFETCFATIYCFPLGYSNRGWNMELESMYPPFTLTDLLKFVIGREMELN